MTAFLVAEILGGLNSFQVISDETGGDSIPGGNIANFIAVYMHTNDGVLDIGRGVIWGKFCGLIVVSENCGNIKCQFFPMFNLICIYFYGSLLLKF